MLKVWGRTNSVNVQKVMWCIAELGIEHERFVPAVLKAGIEALFKLGYRGKSDLEQSRYRFMQAEDQLASSVNRLSTYQATRKQLENYEFRMQKLQLEGDVSTAEQNLVQTKTSNEAQLAKAEAAKIEDGYRFSTEY